MLDIKQILAEVWKPSPSEECSFQLLVHCFPAEGCDVLGQASQVGRIHSQHGYSLLRPCKRY
jgi:hypothetical protein